MSPDENHVGSSSDRRARTAGVSRSREVGIQTELSTTIIDPDRANLLCASRPGRLASQPPNPEGLPTSVLTHEATQRPIDPSPFVVNHRLP